MSAPQCYASGIDPSTIPGEDLDPEAIEAAADGMTADANTIRDAGADVVSTWRGLGGCYQAPEAETLFAVMDPVETNARDFADDLAAVATALRNFAADIRPIKSGFAAVRADAWDFRDTIASNAEWEYDQDLINENTDLLRRVNALQVQLWEAERTCANAIRALYGAAPWHAMTSEDDPLGYGIDEIPTDADMPWGSEVQRRDHCPKSAAVGVKRFVWDGVIVDGIWGTVTGLGMLVGIDGTGWHWETMRDSWVGMGSLIGYSGGEWSWGNAGQAWLGLGKGLIAWDTWEDDPARAAGGAIFNVATILIPAGAAVSGTKGAATAAGTASRVSTWLARGARIVDLTDPVALTIRGARLVLPKIDDLLVGMRGALEGLTSNITVPDVPVTALDDLAVPGLDDLPTTGLDDLPAIHTPDLDLPTVRTPDLDLPPVRTPDLDVPAVDTPVRVPEPVRVGGGPDTPTTPDAPTTPSGPGGVGHGADDLLSGPRDPNTPGTTTGTDAPTGTHTAPDTPHTGGDTPHAGGDTPGGHTPDSAPGGSAADDAVPGGAADEPAAGGDGTPDGHHDDPHDDGGHGDDSDAGDPTHDPADGLDTSDPSRLESDLDHMVDETAGISDAAAFDAVAAEKVSLFERLAGRYDEGSFLRRLFEGSKFNWENYHRYEFREVLLEHVIDPGPPPVTERFRVDSYSPGDAVVSRKLTQLGEVQPRTAIAYVDEVLRKYNPTNPRLRVLGTDANLAQFGERAADLVGDGLDGRMVLEVPVQRAPIPAEVLEYAMDKGVLIRDVTGTEYLP